METKTERRVLLVKGDLIRGFREAGLAEGQTVIAHCAMRKLGFVVGGAETVVRALLEVLGEEGTLVMPSQTWKNLDPSEGVHWEEPVEWWPALRKHWPAYDPRVTPSIGMGAVAEMLRTWPGACRSAHPARSFAAVGKHAAEITAHHDLSRIFDDSSPLGKLYELDARVLLIGVGHDKNTSLHLAETRARFAGKRHKRESSAVMRGGVREWVSYETQAVDDGDFKALGAAFEREIRLQPCFVGGAEVRLLRQRQLVDWAVDWMERHRN
ncbi:aminoglycoside N(3)-acetyltransferase [Paenibacillus soyae]|uniref:Aminoglycoside N(3)-acetyltransferase n=1 Tax=Paenibacillus soyae TaxID=2969249 RepID=A0A9X2MUD1_9BACL|nr:AAC(3) family N-acetyltransferase [Paenibacillus soyae]MCR2806680.1 AAC(3) family N-acetyltransferase [Paenibacillus soyae]